MSRTIHSTSAALVIAAAKPHRTQGQDLSWQDFAVCAETDPEAFFPEKGSSTRLPKRLCRGCPVQQLCLEYALEHDEMFGIWGGFSERERRAIKRQRLRAATITIPEKAAA